MKIVILIRKKAGLTREQFIHHYESSHAVIGKRLLGHLWTRYVRKYPRALLDISPKSPAWMMAMTLSPKFGSRALRHSKR
jgi:hypothetical protein